MLFFLLVLANLNFPGSLNFLAELFLYVGIVGVSLGWALLCILPTFFSCLFWFYMLNRKSLFLQAQVLGEVSGGLMVFFNVLVIYGLGVWGILY